MWRVPARRVPLAELLEQRLFGWVGACPGQPVDLVALQQVEHAPVGERPHAKAPEPDQRFLVVERLRQQRPCLGQEGRVLPRLALREEEPRVLDRDGRLRGEERERRQPVGGEGSRDEIVLEVEEPYELMAHDGEAEDRPRRVAGEVRIRRELAGAGRNVLEDHRLPREAHVVHDGYGQRGCPRRAPPCSSTTWSRVPTSFSISISLEMVWEAFATESRSRCSLRATNVVDGTGERIPRSRG